MSSTAVLDAYRSQLDSLAGQTDTAAQNIFSAWMDGQTTEAAAVLALAGAINRANAKATALADYYLAAQITAATGTPTPTVGLIPEDGSDRLVKAAQTTLSLTREATHAATQATGERSAAGESEAETPDPAARLTRLARSEPLETAQNATSDAMQKQTLVEGWVRELHEGACQLCVWWWREGRVWPKSHKMPTHKGCLCSQRVVLVEKVKPVATRRTLNVR